MKKKRPHKRTTKSRLKLKIWHADEGGKGWCWKLTARNGRIIPVAVGYNSLRDAIEGFRVIADAIYGGRVDIEAVE